nr:carboxymuconolactone decarboxylase family protein [Bacillus subtilis]WGE06496.1 carboxymuconolactone decarboxylase family protein [Bacillus subtilis]
MANKQTAGREQLGEFAPKFAELNDDVLFGDIWAREEELSPRDRSMITVSALIAGGNVEQLTPHLHKAKENGLTKEKIAEIITHLSFYAGWYLKLGQHFKSQKRSLHMKRKKDN